ncbi:MAG TPA: glycosyltransferase family 4 protein [Candidatus Paceibacterota bacterium]|nr:glycosyltransferase family 4 protein [Candidatus Paceibacterota bacterium]
MRLLINSSTNFYEHFEQFGKQLSKFKIEYKLLKDVEGYDSFSLRKIFQTKQIRKNYVNLIKNYRPDFVLTDKPSHLSLAAIECKIPLLIYLRGDYWQELKWADETIYKNISIQYRFALKRWRNLVERCFKNSFAIITVSKYLKNIVKEHYPKKSVFVMFPGIDSSLWFPQGGIKLKHPCVGLVQTANIWGKTKEMLILPKIMEAMPNVTFYWGGDGPYKNKILPELQKFKNFEWVGNLDYPDKVRQFFTEIDVYALFSGFDSLGMTSVEAGFMRKPVVISNVGGTSETILNEKTGFLIEKGNTVEWIEKLSLLINKKEASKKMGEKGFDFVVEKFGFDSSVKEFIDILESITKKANHNF